AIGVTDPSASRRTGTTFLIAVTTSTGTARGPFWRVACATAPSDHKPPRVATAIAPAATSTTTAPATNVRFFITVPRRPSGGPPGPSLSFLVPAITILFVMGDEPSNISLVTYRRKNGVTFMTTRHAAPRRVRHAELKSHRTTPIFGPHAHRHLERQFHQAKDRQLDRVAVRAAARHRLPAGDQMRGWCLPARALRSARLQCCSARTEDLQRRRAAVEISPRGRDRAAPRRRGRQSRPVHGSDGVDRSRRATRGIHLPAQWQPTGHR